MPTGWTSLDRHLSPAVLAEVLDGGQTFRWSCNAAGVWQGIWSEHQVQLRLADHNTLEWRPVGKHQPNAGRALRDYLALDTDFAALADSLPWRSDPHLAQCLNDFPGLRIPRQPFGETLLCFLCSATKQIVQIKEMVALLAKNHGRQLTLGRDTQPAGPRTGEPALRSLGEGGPPVPTVHALPSWDELAKIPEIELRNCQLGFRARYIAATAQYLAARPGWLGETEHLPYPEAKARLLGLPGVGSKVADCVLLFGAGKLEAFPVDTWILKSMSRHYGLTGWSPAQITHFGRVHFGPLAGLAQQYLFAWERAQSRM